MDSFTYTFIILFLVLALCIAIASILYLIFKKPKTDIIEDQMRMLEESLRKQNVELQLLSAAEFENIAGRTLDRQSRRLNIENQRELDAILSPLKENLKDFRRAVDDSYMKENSSRIALTRQIDSLIAANSSIGEETRRLSAALRGNTRLQGEWGESILKRILETSGFLPDIHYLLQPMEIDGKNLEDDEKHRLRPDMIFLLPGNARIVVDSKTSMTAYLNYCDASSDEEEQTALREHVASVRRHIDKLSRTQYHKHVPGAIEHTLMFMPNDGAYIAAIRRDPELPDYALRNNVAIVSPAHLLSVISLISQLWRTENQNKNAEEIARLGGLLYDKIATFLTDFESLEKYISNLEAAYDKTLRHIQGGPASIASRAAKLRDLGAKTTKHINV